MQALFAYFLSNFIKNTVNINAKKVKERREEKHGNVFRAFVGTFRNYFHSQNNISFIYMVSGGLYFSSSPAPALSPFCPLAVLCIKLPFNCHAPLRQLRLQPPGPGIGTCQKLYLHTPLSATPMSAGEAQQGVKREGRRAGGAWPLERLIGRHI